MKIIELLASPSTSTLELFNNLIIIDEVIFILWRRIFCGDGDIYNKKIMNNRKQELVICSNPNCEKQVLKNSSEVKRNLKIGRLNYCSLSCSGMVNHQHLKKFSKENQIYLINVYDNRKDEYTGLREHLRRVKKRDPNYDITIEDLLLQWNQQNGICVYSGVKLNHPKDGGSNMIKASLDRIDSSKGYIKGNIQFISISCNHAKNSMTHEEMLEFCEIISNHYKKKIH